MKSYGLYDLGNALVTTISAPCIQVAIDNATSEIEHTEAELDYIITEISKDEYRAFNGAYFIEEVAK